MVPARFGGYQTSIRTYIDVMAEARARLRVDVLGGEPDQRVRLARVALSRARAGRHLGQRIPMPGSPDRWRRTATTVPVDGGWRVTGRWPWASGSMHAQWAACGIHMKNEQGEMVNLGLSLMPIGELTIEDTWFMAGMKGTGSNTIVAKDVFVPEHRFLPYPPAFGGTIGPSTPTKSSIARRSCRSPC